MMNIRAIFVLLSSLGAVMFLSPEPTMRRINNEIIFVEAAAPVRHGKAAVESAKKAAEDVVHTASDYAKHTGEGIRHIGEAAYDKLSASARDGEARAHHTYHDASARAHHAYDDASEHAAELRDRLGRRTHEAYDQSSHAASEYGSELRDRAGRARESLERRAHEAYEDTADAASEYGSQARDRAARARDALENGARQTYEDSSEASHRYAHEMRDRMAGAAGNARDRTGEYVSSGVHSAREKLGDKVHGAGDAAHSLGERIKGEEEHESVLSKLARVKEALKEKVHGAVEYQPHLGQGVGYYSPEDHEEEARARAGGYIKRKTDEGASKMEDYLEGARASARDAMEKASEGLELLRNQLQEPDPREDHPTLETARGRIRSYYDITKGAVLNALTKKEQQLGSSLESAKRYAEEHYEKAKEASLRSMEHQKDKLGQYLEMVRMKLNSGRETVFNYAMSTIQNSKEAIVDEKNKLYHKVQELEHGAKQRVNHTLEQAGQWAHDKMVKLNEKEEMAKRWIHKSVVIVVRLLHLFVFTSVYGSALWVTFVSGFVLSRQIPRQQFAIVQSKIFPVYFRMIGSGIALLLATHTLLHPVPTAGLPELLQYYNLSSCLILTLLNTFVLEPRVTKTIFDKLRLEKEEGRGVDAGQVPVMDEQTRLEMIEVGKKLQVLHTWSSLVNLGVLAGMTWHLWYLNCRLVI